MRCRTRDTCICRILQQLPHLSSPLVFSHLLFVAVDMERLQLLFILTALFCWRCACADILVLNDATFTEKVKEKDTIWFVKFCVPWCKHCHHFDSMWKELGKDLDMEDGVEVAQVDCTISKTTCTNVKIKSYPTLKLFYDGEDHKTYKGKREIAELKRFALEAVVNITNVVIDEL